MKIVAGVDEAGRGALAGPVVAASVILRENYTIHGLTDSKKLNRLMRERLADEIRNNCICWSYSCGSVEEIDRINILQSTLLTMKRAIESMDIQPDLALIDGNQLPDLQIEAKAIVKGDLYIPAISAASILAKVTRDRIMFELVQEYPEYGFDKHVGYGTKQHIAAIHRYGVLPIHRAGFAPVKNLLNNLNMD